MIVIGNKSYEVLEDHRNGWNAEAFRSRYSEVLDRYDYIVGDWGYNQLRLKGFYRDNHPKAPKELTYSAMSDYINEYCNFGCAYFVIHKSKEIKDPKELKELKEQELKEAREAQEKRAQLEANGPENFERKDVTKSNGGCSGEQGTNIEQQEYKVKRESKDAKDAKDVKDARESRPNKSSKSWKEPKHRDHRESRVNHKNQHHEDN